MARPNIAETQFNLALRSFVSAFPRSVGVILRGDEASAVAESVMCARIAIDESRTSRFTADEIEDVVRVALEICVQVRVVGDKQRDGMAFRLKVAKAFNDADLGIQFCYTPPENN